MCCEADWKREIVPDHKFDFINVAEFHRNDFITRIKYIWKYVLILKSVAVYGFDIFTAATMILSDHWTNAIQRKCGDDCAIDVKFSIAKWIFVGCIIFSFLLLGYETWKAKKAVMSRDISYAFTNLIANDYYSLKSYDNFCLFCHIDNSTKKTDDLAFFVFFQFKDWKRLLLADGPRQSINALTLYSFAYANGFTTDIPSYWEGSIITAMLLFSIVVTVLIFVGSLLLLIAAAILYIPLLCYIQGNLKEYVCHKVDKRISELIKKKQRDRIRRAAALEKKANGGRGGKGELPGAIPQPTLPDVSLDDDDEGLKRKMDAERGVGVKRGMTDEFDPYGAGYPPTLEYNQPYVGGYDQFGSTASLAAHAAPVGISYPPASRPAARQPSYGSSVLPDPYLSDAAPSYPPPSSRSVSDHSHRPAFPPSRSVSGMGHQPSFPPSRSRTNVSRPGIHPYQHGESYDSSRSFGQYDGTRSFGSESAVTYDEPDVMPYDRPQDGGHYGYGSQAGHGSQVGYGSQMGHGQHPAGRYGWR